MRDGSKDVGGNASTSLFTTFSLPPSLPPQGSFKALPPLPLLSSPSSLAPYSLIVATQMDEGSLRLLAAAAAAAAKPLLIARSYGLLGYLR